MRSISSRTVTNVIADYSKRQPNSLMSAAL